jgi:hypothetical protein
MLLDDTVLLMSNSDACTELVGACTDACGDVGPPYASS